MALRTLCVPGGSSDIRYSNGALAGPPPRVPPQAPSSPEQAEAGVGLESLLGPESSDRNDRGRHSIHDGKTSW